MTKRSTPETRYQVLSCVMEHLPVRTQARFRAVSKEVKAMAPDGMITKPLYADLLDHITGIAIALPCIGLANATNRSMTVITADGNDIGVDVVFDKHKGVVRFQIGNLDHTTWDVLLTCKPHRLKYFVYRTIERNKTIKRLEKMQIDHALAAIAIEYKDMVEVK